MCVFMSACVQAQPDVKFSILVTGDHSTPVMFGDHSHEPVPLAYADVADVVASLGKDTVRSFDLGPLPALTQHVEVPEGELQAQAQEKKLLRQKSLHASQRQWSAATNSCKNKSPEGRTDVVEVSILGPDDFKDGRVDGSSGELREKATFDEISAAKGMLGRFPSSELMLLIRSSLSL
jgi:hypothetical protein